MHALLVPPKLPIGQRYTMHLENRHALIKGVGRDVHERLYGPEPV